MAASNIQYEIADRTRAINAGGINAAHLLVKRLGLDQAPADPPTGRHRLLPDRASGPVDD